MRIAIISDIHGNQVALEAVLQDLERQPAIDQLVIAGDLCLNGPCPRQVLEIVQELNCPVLQGNVDVEVVTQAPEKGEKKRRALITSPPCHFPSALLTPAAVIFSSCMPIHSMWRMPSFPMHPIAHWSISWVVWMPKLAPWLSGTCILLTRDNGGTCYLSTLAVVGFHVMKTTAPLMAFLAGKKAGRQRFVV